MAPSWSRAAASPAIRNRVIGLARLPLDGRRHRLDQGFELRRRLRPGEQITLTLVAAEFDQLTPDRFVLDAFGRGGEIQALCHLYDGMDDGAVLRIDAEAAHEGLIDF